LVHTRSRQSCVTTQKKKLVICVHVSRGGSYLAHTCSRQSCEQCNTHSSITHTKLLLKKKPFDTCTGIEENEGQSLGTHTLEAVMCEMQHAQWEFAFVARKEGMNTRGGEVFKGEGEGEGGGAGEGEGEGEGEGGGRGGGGQNEEGGGGEGGAGGGGGGGGGCRMKTGMRVTVMD